MLNSTELQMLHRIARWLDHRASGFEDLASTLTEKEHEADCLHTADALRSAARDLREHDPEVALQNALERAKARAWLSACLKKQA